jgi:hypothetical protein
MTSVQPPTPTFNEPSPNVDVAALERRVVGLEMQGALPRHEVPGTAQSAAAPTPAILDHAAFDAKNTARHAKMIAEHERDSRDSAWAHTTEDNLRKAVALLDARDGGIRGLRDVTCHMTTCLAHIEIEGRTNMMALQQLVIADRANTCRHELWRDGSQPVLNVFLECDR